ncbi:MAG: hypothetical protein ABI821_17860 [Pseudomonadota bacterium]
MNPFRPVLVLVVAWYATFSAAAAAAAPPVEPDSAPAPIIVFIAPAARILDLTHRARPVFHRQARGEPPVNGRLAMPRFFSRVPPNFSGSSVIGFTCLSGFVC